LTAPAALIAQATQVAPSISAVNLVPRFVPAQHRKARSAQREAVLLCAFQSLVALALFARAQAHPPDDPSPLRFWLAAQYRIRGQLARLIDAASSPAVPEAFCGPAG
jgi:hypothetical protein